MDYIVELKQTSPRHLAVVRFTAKVEEVGEKIGDAFGAVMAYATRQGHSVTAPAIAVYDQHGDGFEVAAGFPVEGPIEGDEHVLPFILPATEVAATTHMGSYAELPAAYEAIKAWMQAHGREEAGTIMWEEYWSDPSTPPAETRTDIYWPLKPL